MSTATTTAPPVDLAAVDLNDPRLYDDPWELYRWLRANAPIWYDANSGLYAISTHADVHHISRHQERYSAAKGVRPRVPTPMGLISMDDPEHTRQRRLVNRGFTPRRVRELADHIRDITNATIDEIAEKGEVDFVEDFAIHVPLIVIAEMLGLDPEARLKLYRWSDDMMAGDGHMDPDDPVLHRSATAFGEYVTHCQALIAARRKTPADDLISILTKAYDEGELAELDGDLFDVTQQPLDDEELIMFLVLLIVAGNETTRNAITGGLMAFTEFPEEKQRLIDDPSLIDLATEEIIRYVSPVISFIRTVTEDHTYRGVDFVEGDRVLLLYQSANRDEAVFDEPDRLVLDRDPNPHLAFGTGTHYCLGANLARLEVKIVFQELFRRLRDIRTVGAHQRGDSALVLAIEHLPAAFTPEAAPRP